MSKTNSKLGRNPLAKVQARSESPTKSTNPLLNPAMGVRRPLTLSFVEKIKELDIRIDWPELYRRTVERRLKRISRFF